MKRLLLVWVLGWLCYGGEWPLFGTVTGVVAPDRLNVRRAPHPDSPRIGTLPPGARVGVLRCLRRGTSRWCRIHQLTQVRYWEGAEEGWVNARYLHLTNRGYVRIDGRAECAYALGCEKGWCRLFVPDHREGRGGIRRKVARRSLRAESRFGAAPPGAEGYCAVERLLPKEVRESWRRAGESWR
jgi:uncharacterized protein YraI